MAVKKILGVDVGASGTKGAIVDVETGELLTERLRLPTPKSGRPDEMAKTFAELVRLLDWEGPIGCGFPAIIKDGVACSAANIHKDWIGTDVSSLFGEATGQNVFVLNDADAAGLTEISFGKGKGKRGVTLIITIGSGLGSALFVNGQLVPNTELGHLFLRGHEKVAEFYASSGARKREGLGYAVWGKRLDEFLLHIDRLFSPNQIILGGGISRKYDLYKEYLTLETLITPAAYQNRAGAIGAAMFAAQHVE
jgi:polyphosphate glucokinase